MHKTGTPPQSAASTDHASVTGEFSPRISSTVSITTAGFVLLSIAALYFGREIFVPFSLAILLSFLLAPPVGWLRHIGLPRVAAVVLIVTVAVAVIGGISVLVGSQAIGIADNLPAYQNTMVEKIRNIRAAATGGGTVDRTTTVIKELGRELADADGAAAGAEGTDTGDTTVARPGEKEPLAVRVEPPEQTPLQLASEVLGSALGPIATAGLVIVFVFFVLLSPSDLRDRLIRLSGGDLHRTTEALNEAAERVGRYLLMQLIVNASFGIPLGIGLYLIGVPGALLWALMATLLRFIPYLGPVISAMFPLTMAFVVDPGWDMVLWAAVLILVLELISNNVIEPWLYGSSTGMTPIAVILSAIFWTLLWGPVGLVLATPITVCLVVIGRYVPQLQFIEILLGSEPVLTNGERLYQRLLGGNVEDAIDIAETETESGPVLDFFDHAALPALRLAEKDRERGISGDEYKQVAAGLQTMVQAMATIEKKQDEEDEAAHRDRWLGTPVLCIAGRGELDAAAAMLLMQTLESRGIGARMAPASEVTLVTVGGLELAGVEVVCLSYLHRDPRAYARFVCRRLRPRAPQLKIVVGAWNLAPETGDVEKLQAETGADAVVTSLTEASRLIEDMVGHGTMSATPPPLPAQEAARLQALEKSGALAPQHKQHLDRVARYVAAAMDAPIGLVSLIDDSSQLWKGAVGLPEDLELTRQAERELSVCTHVVASDAPLVVEDTARDSRFAHNPFLRTHGMRFYAGVPLRTASGHVIGSLCVVDFKPRTISPREVKLMQVIADELMTDLALVAEPQPSGEQPASAIPSATVPPALPGAL